MLISSQGCRTAETRTVGTFIEGGYILTVAHGVVGQSSNRITTKNGASFDVQIVSIDIEQDLALLRIAQTSKTELLAPVALAEAKIGERLLFVAFEDESQFTRETRVKRKLRIDTQDIYRRGKVARPGLEVELQVDVGNSGGPLFNESGQLVGIVWATSRVVDYRTWATRSEAIKTMLSESLNDASANGTQPLACTG